MTSQIRIMHEMRLHWSFYPSSFSLECDGAGLKGACAAIKVVLSVKAEKAPANDLPGPSPSDGGGGGGIRTHEAFYT